MGGICQLSGDFFKSRISVGREKYNTVYACVHPDSFGILSVPGGIPAQDGENGKYVKERVSGAYGDSGSLGGAVVEVSVPAAGALERAAASAWDTGAGLDEFRLCFLDSGI